MHTSYHVADTAGHLLGIFPTNELTAVKSLVDANPGATVRAVATIDNPCHSHPAFEADNCPSCGTARMSF